MRRIAGTSGTVLGASVLARNVALADDDKHESQNAAPKPIPYGTTVGGVLFHFTFPAPNVAPGSIGDFNGFVGISIAQGTATAKNPDGSTETLLYDSDMRFMKGTYVGKDGNVHKGTFGFIWLDLFRGQYDFTNFSTQVHDLEPGIDPYPDGLFWTVPIDDDAVDIHLGDGSASMQVENVSLLDFFTIPNGLFRFLNPVSAGATISFEIEWSGPVTNRTHVSDPTNQVAADLLLDQATIQFSAQTATGFKVESNSAGATSEFAQLGRMRNGVFF